MEAQSAGRVPAQMPVGACARELSHVGIAARSLEETAARFAELWGSSWCGHGIDHDWICPASPEGWRHVRGRALWLGAATPRIELLEARTGSPWELPDGIDHRLDHLSYWVSDLTASATSLGDQGFVLEYTMPPTEPRTVRGFAYLRSPSGVRIELQPASDKPAIARWLAGGELKLDWGF